MNLEGLMSNSPASRSDERAATAAMSKAVRILRRGGLVAFPTETVYGLGARLSDTAAIARVFGAKGRPVDNPLIIHVPGWAQALSLVRRPPRSVKPLVAAFWPGPLTLVLKRSKRVPGAVTAGLNTVAIRCPAHPVAQRLIRALGEPIAAPSANRSGRPSPTRADHVRADLGDRVDMILDGGPCRLGLESTVLDLTRRPPRLLRHGAVTIEAIAAVIGRIRIEDGDRDSGPARSPGLRHRHYAPRVKMILVDPGPWASRLGELKHARRRIGLICRKNGLRSPRRVGFYRRFETLSDYASGLFASLLEAERAGIRILLVERVRKRGLGWAIMDRLQRAAAG